MRTMLSRSWRASDKIVGGLRRKVVSTTAASLSARLAASYRARPKSSRRPELNLARGFGTERLGPGKRIPNCNVGP